MRARHEARRAAAAALAYLALALWSLRAVLPAPAALLPHHAEAETAGMLILDRADQAFSVRAIADNAHRLATAPWTLLEGGQCFPLPASHTLGEHVLGEGLLGAIPWALSRDPILTFNAVAVLSLVLPALAMYALGLAWTGSAAAAFVAGVLFGFHPARLAAVSKPFLAGNAWTPLVLLFVHRLFVARRWRDAVLLAAFGGLQLLSSFYQVLGAALLAGAFAVGLAIAHRRELGAIAPRLAAALAAIAVVAVWVLGPYLHAREAWGTLQGRTPIFFYWRHFFAPGGPAYPGTLAIALAAVGLADRARGAWPRRGQDPRLPLAAAAVLVVWCLSTGIALPGVGVTLPSPIALAAGVVPGLDAVRALPLARFAWLAAVAALAAYGVRAAVGLLPRSWRIAAAAALALGAVLETSWAPLARLSYLERPVVRAHRARPPEAEIALYRSVPPGAVLDLPLRPRPDGPPGALAAVPALRAGAWHLRPIAACYNSFTTPVLDDVERIAERWPERSAVDQLVALGFGSVLVHEAALTEAERRDLAASAAASLLGRADGLALYALRSDAPWITGTDALVPGLTHVPTPEAAAVQGGSGVPVAGVTPGADGRATVVVALRNAGEAVLRHADPIAPSPVRVRWRSADGRIVLESRERLLLPLALGLGETTWRRLDLELPAEPGLYDVEVALESEPGRIIADARVRLDPHDPRARRLPARAAWG